MNCDELQYERLGDANKTYPASTLVIRKQFVDATIDKLKARIHDLESMPHTDNSAVIEKLVQENERLVKCCKEYDSRQRIDEQIKFNAAKQLRATKRALWLARADRAKDRAITCDDFAYLGDTERNISMTLARTWMKCRLLKPSEWSKVWKKVERKCRAKAEEYK